MRLTREIRLSTSPSETGVVANSWSGSDGSQQLAAFWTIRITVEGPVDPRTGYLCDLRRLDAIARDVLIPRIRDAARRTGSANDPGLRDAAPIRPASLMSELLRSGQDAAPEGVALQSVSLHLSPHVGSEARREETPMIRVTHAYEFCAAHRLHCPDFSPEENLRVFGKCSNPHGHGHNYVLEVTVLGEPDARTGLVGEGPQLDQLVKTHVLDAFDHKNLNVECEEFKTMNPSVENIAQVIWTKLSTALTATATAGGCGPESARGPSGIRLANVRVWETAKTYADCSDGM